MGFYEENFEKARSDFEADIPKVVKALFRAGRPEGRGQPSLSALVRNQGSWFPTGIPDLPIDTSVLTEEDFHTYAAELERNGFFGPDSWYMNHGRNGEFAKQAVNDGKLRCRCCFFTARTITSAKPSTRGLRNRCVRIASD